MSACIADLCWFVALGNRDQLEKVLLLLIFAVIPILYLAASRYIDRRFLLVLSAVCTFAFVAALWFNLPKGKWFGWDYPGFYIAGKLPIELLYNRSAILKFADAHLAPLGITHYNPYVRPAIFAFFAKPFAILPYWTAFGVWASFWVACYCLAVALLTRFAQLPVNILPGFAAFAPALFGILNGQDISGLLLLLAIGSVILRRKESVLGGIILGLCCYKFNLAYLLPFALASHRRWRPLAGFLATASSIFVASILVSPLSDYLHLLKQIPYLFPDTAYSGLRGILTSARIGHLYPLFAAVLLPVVVLIMRKLSAEGAIAFSIIAAVFLSPQCAWYDATVFLVPVAAAWQYCGQRLKIALFILISAAPAWILFENLTQFLFVALSIIALLRMRKLPVAAETTLHP